MVKSVLALGAALGTLACGVAAVVLNLPLLALGAALFGAGAAGLAYAYATELDAVRLEGHENLRELESARRALEHSRPSEPFVERRQQHTIPTHLAHDPGAAVMNDSPSGMPANMSDGLSAATPFGARPAAPVPPTAPATPAANAPERSASELEQSLDMVFDPETGLLDERFFAVIVQQRVAAARRQLQPVSVVLFELDGFAGESTAVQRDALISLGEVLRRTLRESDSACRIGDLMAAAILEDTTESGAVWAAERIRNALSRNASGRSVTLSAGVACYPSHALSAPELVSMAGKALEQARSRGRDNVEIAPLAE